MYAAQYPAEVIGIVLLDASHPEHFNRYPEREAANQEFSRLSAIFPLLARLGLFHFYFAAGGELDFQDLPLAVISARTDQPAEWSELQSELASRRTALT